MIIDIDNLTMYNSCIELKMVKKTKEAIERAMRVAQRELPNDKLKAEVLGQLVELLGKVEEAGDGNKPDEE
jgi:hypothetical protein